MLAKFQSLLLLVLIVISLSILALSEEYKASNETVLSNVVCAGYDISTAVDVDGNLWSWGNNDKGQLGLGDFDNRMTMNQVNFSSTGEVLSFESLSSSIFTLALDDNGRVWSWGPNSQGQLGTGDLKDRYLPQAIPLNTTFAQISAGSYHSLALDDNGFIWTWGGNDHGQLGTGNKEKSTHPQRIKSFGIENHLEFLEISAGNAFSMALDMDGKIWSWGKNDQGQLGVSDKNEHLVPVKIGLAANFTSVSCGVDHTVAVDSEGQLWAWGGNSMGQLGTGDQKERTHPVKVKASKNHFRYASAGNFYTLAIDDNGTVFAWGNNKDGELGLGDKKNRDTPSKIDIDVKFEVVSAGLFHSLGLDEKQQIWAWGSNDYGQLGLGDNVTRTTPHKVYLHPTPEPSSPDKNKWKLPVIIASSVGGALLILIVVVVIVGVWYKRKDKDAFDRRPLLDQQTR